SRNHRVPTGCTLRALDLHLFDQNDRVASDHAKQRQDPEDSDEPERAVEELNRKGIGGRLVIRLLQWLAPAKVGQNIACVDTARIAGRRTGPGNGKARRAPGWSAARQAGSAPAPRL